jgi:hypothetical protein
MSTELSTIATLVLGDCAKYSVLPVAAFRLPPARSFAWQVQQHIGAWGEFLKRFILYTQMIMKKKV